MSNEIVVNIIDAKPEIIANIIASGPKGEPGGVTSINGRNGEVTLAKSDVGLSNVDNTSDTEKPISTEQQTALDTKLDKTSVVNDLTTGGVTKALSAEQGKALNASISELNAGVDFNVTNLVTNGNFSNGATGWSTTAGEISAVANTLTQTCNGSAKTAYINQTYAFITNHKYYARAFLRVTNSSCTSLTLRTWVLGVVYDQAISNPVINTWYPFSFLATAGTSGTNGIFALQTYIDAATANGKAMEVQYVEAIDLTAAFGAGNEPTAKEMDTLLALFPNSWFDGTITLTQKQILTWTLNLIRKNTSAIVALGGTIV